MLLLEHGHAIQGGASFDTYLQENAGWSGVVELMGGQALLHDHTMEAELKQLWELADKQVQIARCSDTKFSNMAFTLLQKMQQAILGTSGIAKKFIDDMATTGLNFIRDAAVYEAKLSASDGVVFTAGQTSIWGRIAELIREAEELELMYEGAQKEFASILEWVGKEVKEYLDKQSVADCTVFMDESFANLRKFSDTFNVLSYILVVMGTVITHHSLLTSLRVNVSHIPLKILLLSQTADDTVALGQMALLGYEA